MKAYNLDDALRKPDEVKALFIHRRGLREWPSAIWSFPHLEHLDLSANALSDIPWQALKRLPQLKRLNLSNNQILNLSAKAITLPALQHLDLSQNQLKNLKGLTGMLPQLQQLYLAANQISELTIELEEWPNLQKLNLRKNKIKRLTAAIGHCLQLKELDLAHNQLAELPNQIGQCIALEQLDVSNNRLKQIPKKIGQCRSLYRLNVQHNQLQNIPDELGKCQQLQWLNLSHNQLTKIPDEIKWRLLRELDLSTNRLTTFPVVLKNCHWLRRLLLNKNQLTQLPEQWGGLKHLEVLALQYNQLEILPDTLSELKQLRTLRLKANPLKTFPKVLTSLYALRAIDGLHRFSDSRRLLSFLSACRKEQLPLSLAWPFYQLLQGESPGLSLVQAWRARSFPMKKIQVQALEIIRSKGGSLEEYPLSEAKEVACLGSIQLKKTFLKSQLKEKGIIYCTSISPQTTHILLGTKAKFPTLEIPSKVVYLREQELYAFLQSDQQWLSQANDQQIRRLAHLLLSQQEANVQLALQLLKSGGMIPDALLTELFWAAKTIKQAGLQKQLRQLFRLQVSEEVYRLCFNPQFLKATLPPEKLNHQLALITDKTPLDAEKLRTYYLNA